MIRQRIAFLHGFTGSPQSWQKVIEELGDDYDIVAPLLFGHLDFAPASIQRFDDEVSRLIECTSSSASTWLCGYSLGGRLALRMAMQEPARFAGVIIVSASPGLKTDEQRLKRRRQDAIWAQLLRNRGLDEFLRQWESLDLWHTQKHLPDSVLAELAEIRRSQTAQALARSLEVLGLAEMPNTWSALEKAAAPMHWIAGELDSKFCEIAKRACDKNSKFRCTILQHTGHNIPLEAPAVLAHTILTAIENPNAAK